MVLNVEIIFILKIYFKSLNYYFYSQNYGFESQNDAFGSWNFGFESLNYDIKSWNVGSYPLIPSQLPGGRSDESGPQWTADQGPHVVGSGPGPIQTAGLPAAGPAQPAQQAGARPAPDAAWSRQPLGLQTNVLVLKLQGTSASWSLR